MCIARLLQVRLSNVCEYSPSLAPQLMVFKTTILSFISRLSVSESHNRLSQDKNLTLFGNEMSTLQEHGDSDRGQQLNVDE